MPLKHTANKSIQNWKDEIYEKYKILAKFMSDRQHRDINAMKDTLLYMEYAKAYHFKKVRHVKTPYGDNCLTWVYCYYCHLNLKSHQNVGYTRYTRVLILSWEREYLRAKRLLTDCSFIFWLGADTTGHKGQLTQKQQSELNYKW